MKPARRRTLAGYELEHRLGEGATSTVWRARQQSSMGRPVALKFVRDLATARAEVEALAALDHPHVVRVLELVEEGDQAAIAMQLAAGGSLDERLRRRGPMAPAEVAELMAKVAGALASAHRRGVLHRDLKPANVLFTADGEPLLSDFGLASDDGRIRGTAPYLDPTVRAGRSPDVAADVYGLGAVAFEMLIGTPPPGPDPRVPATVPPVLAAVVARCLAADPGDRFAGADEVAKALQTPVPAAPTSVPAAGPAAEEHLDPVATTRDFGPRPPQVVPDLAPSGRRAGRLLAVPAGVALVVAGLVLLLRPAPETVDAPRPVAARVTVPCAPVTTGADVLVGDTDGDGCPDTVRRTGNVLERAGVRYALGDDGDEAQLGDWDCDGVATPGLRRAATGALHLFDGWAGTGDPIEASTVVDSPPPACP